MASLSSAQKRHAMPKKHRHGRASWKKEKGIPVSSTIKKQATLGRRMDDIFLGDTPEIVSSIVWLPRVVRVSVSLSDDTQKTVRVSRATQEDTSSSPADLNSFSVQDEHKKSSEKNTVSSPQPLPVHSSGEDVHVELPAIATLPEVASYSAEQIRKELFEELFLDEVRETRLQKSATQFRQEVRKDIMSNRRSTLPTSAHIHARTEKSQWSFADMEKWNAAQQRLREEKEHTLASPFSSSREISHSSSQFLLSEKPFVSPLVAPPIAWKTYREASRLPEPLYTPVKKPQRSSPPSSSSRKRVSSRRQIKKPNRTQSRSRFSFREGVRIFATTIGIGCVISMVGSVYGAPSLAARAQATADAAMGHLLSGFRHIAVANVTASDKEFGEASTLFLRAEKDIQSSTSLTVRLLASVDPKERLSSGQKLLEAGQLLSDIGTDIGVLIRTFQTGSTGKPLTETIEQALPLLKLLSGKLTHVDVLVKEISLNALPLEKRGELTQLQTTVHALSTTMASLVDSHDVLLELLGADRDRQYLIVFENNRELRPAGGFIGSFALVRMSRGVVQNIHVDTIYNPDGQLHDFIEPPAPLKKLTDRWFTRDANWFADFSHSATKVSQLFERSGGPTPDGVIAVTPTVLERLLRVTGPIEMPAYNITVTPENVIDETQRLVSYDYDRTKNPKAFLADLMPEVLNRLLALPQDRWGEVASVLTQSLEDKHLLLSFRNEEAQQHVNTLHWGGRVEETNGDYLQKVEANVGGTKTDDLIDTSVVYTVSVDAAGTATATLVTTRHHIGSQGGDPSVDPRVDWRGMPNSVYERTLVPKGSVLLEAHGFTNEDDIPVPYMNTSDYSTFTHDPDVQAVEREHAPRLGGTYITEEDGKTSFGNWVLTKPGETTVTVYTYRLPSSIFTRSMFGNPFHYSLLAQQQPGHKPIQFQATLHFGNGAVLSWIGPEHVARQRDPHTATFTTLLSRDSVWGVVAEPQ